MQEELKEFAAPKVNPLRFKYEPHANEVVNEAREGSEFDREENVFSSHNISEESAQKRNAEQNFFANIN